MFNNNRRRALMVFLPVTIVTVVTAVYMYNREPDYLAMVLKSPAVGERRIDDSPLRSTADVERLIKQLEAVEKDRQAAQAIVDSIRQE